MKTLTATLAALTGLVLLASPAAAQGRGHGNDKGKHGSDHVPPGHLPPAGSCRVWVDGVPPGHQSPPTDCETARRMADRNGGRVIYGGGVDASYRRGDDRYDDRDGGYDDRNAATRCYDRGDRRVDCGSRDATRCYDRDGDRVSCPYGASTNDRGGIFDLPGRRAPDAPSGTSNRAYPSGMPLMSSAIAMKERHVLTDDARRWVGDRAASVKYLDLGGNRIPDVVTWYDDRGQVIQKWLNAAADGRAAKVEIYENGKKVQTIGR